MISKNSTGQITVLRNADGSDGVSFRTRVHPKTTGRPPVPVEVPKEFAEDYNEACYVLNDSPKASAALSRRCLQNIIHNKLGIKKPNLDQEIQEVLDQNIFPADISESLDQVRAIGNFAAHPIKSKSSGEIVEVEPAEADWNLETLEMIFEFLFVRPAEMQKRKESINQKLSDAGKKPLK